MLHPYETQPWMMYDEEQGITCSAEVRIGPGAQDLEAEIQFLYDDAEDTGDEEEEEGEGDGGEPENPYLVKKQDDSPKPKTVIKDGREQVLIMHVIPVIEENWEMKKLTVKTNDYVNAFFEWDEMGCELFRMAIESILRDELPDIEDLLEKTLNKSDYWGGGRRGRVGRKSPKVKPGQLLGMNQKP